MPSPVPVLLVVRELDLGGSERQLAEIAKSLDRERFAPHVGCFRPNGLRGDELRAAGVPVVRFPVHSFRHPSVLTAARQLGRYIQQHRIQLVHTFDVPATLFAVPSARALSPAIVVSSVRAHRDLTPGVTRYLLRITDRIVDGIVVNCDALVQALIHTEHVRPELIHLCHNGVDTNAFYPAETPRVPSLEGASLVVGVVCALRPEKSLQTLLEAFSQARKGTAGLKLAIVGSGPCLPELRDLANTLRISEHCVFEPTTNRVADWLRMMDVFVLPSRSEALSNSLMEAMACGCAVVASRVGGNPELVEDGRAGLLFESGNVSQLTEALEQLLHNQPLRKQLGAAAAILMKERFSIRASAETMGRIYSELIGP